MTLASAATIATVVLVGIAFAVGGAISLVMGIAAGLAALILPLLVRCRVCGLQLETCDEARVLSRIERGQWFETLAACPGCGDDGGASDQFKDDWAKTGGVRQAPYWSVRRVVVTLLALSLAFIGPYLFAVFYEVRP